MEDTTESKGDTTETENKEIQVYKKVIFEPVRIGPVSTLEEMDGKLLRFQNKKLEIKLEEYNRTEKELQARIEQLEKRQRQDNTVVRVVDKYWNHLSNDINSVFPHLNEEYQESTEPIFPFTLNSELSCTESELNQKLTAAVKISTNNLSKIIQSYNYILLKQESLVENWELSMCGKESGFSDSTYSPEKKQDQQSPKPSSKKTDTENNSNLRSKDINNEFNKDVQEVVTELVDLIVKKAEEMQTSSEPLENCGGDDVFISNSQICDKLDMEGITACNTIDDYKNICSGISKDNTLLSDIIDNFNKQLSHRTNNEEEIMKALELTEQEFEEWKAQVDDIEYDNEKLKSKKYKIERHLLEAEETLKKIKASQCNRVKADANANTVKKFEELEKELELQRNLAIGRSRELDHLKEKHQNNLKAIQELEIKLKELPDKEVEDAAEYISLQSQFSVLYNNTIHIKDQIEEFHAHIQTLNATFINKMEMTETEDLMTLRQLQTDLLQMQQVSSQLRREYQSLKGDFENNLIVNEQTSPLNKEMRFLLVRLQKHNKFLKHEALRHKQKYNELNTELNVLSKQDYADSKYKMENAIDNSSDSDDINYDFDMNDESLEAAIRENRIHNTKTEKLDTSSEESTGRNMNFIKNSSIPNVTIKQEPLELHPPNSLSSHLRTDKGESSTVNVRKTRKRHNQTTRNNHNLCNNVAKITYVYPDSDDDMSDDEYVLDLKNRLKKEEEEQKELKLLLDTYKSINRDKRENVQLSCIEMKLKSEIDETRTQMRRILEIKRETRKRMADEKALKKIKHLEKQNFSLLRQINVHKQEEEALLSEMEVTNQAFEDMQEQNSQLIQQLREKDDTNSKLIAERIKSNLLYKITREEQESLQNLVYATAKQLDSVQMVLSDLEDKEEAYQIAINNTEKEMVLRSQILESHMKKALEQSRAASELRLTLEKYLTELEDTKQHIVEKTSTLDSEMFKHNRLQEEVDILRRRMECIKKLEPLETPDVVLVEQIREYKEMLTCQSCKVRRKDAVLSKCFHVFCWECLRTRYETRQRKCPKCNATFGANDYHRLFFTN